MSVRVSVLTPPASIRGFGRAGQPDSAAYTRRTAARGPWHAPPAMIGWRRNLYVIWLATFASIAGASLAMPFLPLFINRDLGVTDPGMAAIWTGLATAGSGVVQAIMSPIWGLLADRHGRKP